MIEKHDLYLHEENCDATREKVPKRPKIIIQIMIVSDELNIALYDSEVRITFYMVFLIQ